MKNRTFFNWLAVFLGVFAITSFCFTPALAEMDDPMSSMSSIESEDDFMVEEPGPDLEISDGAFGQNYQYTWIPIDNFTMWKYNDTYNVTSDYYRYFMNSGYHYLGSGINLPSGAILSGVRAYYYDNHAGNIEVFIWRKTMPSARSLLGSAASSGTPGYGSLYLSLSHTIRNGDGNYVIYVGASTGTSALRVAGVRLFWRRQMRTGLSHPFNDIGGLSSEFQNAIAALYQSGITTGTTPTTYSPFSPVNRGQMATFLARALGLHWAYPY
jgi:S-layer homology domain